MALCNSIDSLKNHAMLTIILFSSVFLLQGQNSAANNIQGDIYFYGGIFKTDDTPKAQVTTDLFFSQFQLEGEFNLVDRRSIEFTQDVLESHQESDDLLFYNTVSQEGDKWYSSLYLIDFSQSREFSVKYVYDEYYRVLIGAKDALTELLQKLHSDANSIIELSENSQISAIDESVTISNLFGTWKGEEHIDKIVILRGGKGFVIFDNGASMNISINVEGTSFSAIQESKSNASFFPELPREVALVKAIEFNPIEWDLTIENEDLLIGIKRTYSVDSLNSDSNAVKETEIPVKWFRQ